MAAHTTMQRSLAGMQCQAQRPLQVPSSLHVHRPRRVEILGSRKQQQRLGFQLVRSSAVAEKPASSNGVPADFKAWESVVSTVKQRDDIKTIMLFGAGPIVIGQVRWMALDGSRDRAFRLFRQPIKRTEVQIIRNPTWTKLRHHWRPGRACDLSCALAYTCDAAAASCLMYFDAGLRVRLLGHTGMQGAQVRCF